jgi:hypothetical protein
VPKMSRASKHGYSGALPPMAANPSIERTSYTKVRLLPAAHVKRDSVEAIEALTAP